jgi:hypothetical protein
VELSAVVLLILRTGEELNAASTIGSFSSILISSSYLKILSGTE